MRAILTYHSIDRTGSVISVTPEDFAAHVEWAASGAARVVSVEELLTLPDSTDAVALTFDDGLQSVATEAAPRLADRGLAATVFVVSDHAGHDNRWRGAGDARIPAQPVIGWDGLGRLAEAGWRIGSHTRHHPMLTRCSDAELEDELAGSATMIAKETGTPAVTFAYPYGDTDARVRAAVGRHYRIACTTSYQPVSTRTDPLDVPRLDAWYFRGRAPFRDWGTPRFRRAIAWRHALRRARRMVA
ncbi:MAG: polysaccharide deacetylase family protein [Gemmatimonadales bacterium]